MPIFGELLEKEISETADKLTKAIEQARQSDDPQLAKAISQLGPAYLDLLSI